MNKPTVFISYSHDSDEHKEKVLSFANQLCIDGIDCLLDQYVDAPVEGWTRWMNNGINDADFVLMICTETYYNRVMGKDPKGIGLGGKFEGRLILTKIYQNDSNNNKFLPVLFDKKDKQFIPDILLDFNHYEVDTDQGYELLYRKITNQPLIRKPEPGPLKKLPGKTNISSFFKSPTKRVRIDITKLPTTNAELFGRDKELEVLDKAWDNSPKMIVSSVAQGGAGKSSKANERKNKLAKNDFQDTERYNNLPSKVPTVFISYSHKDKEWVRNYLLANLEKNGISCHIDFRDFEIGKVSIICMEEAVESCTKSILVYSKNWVESEFSQFESVMLQTDSPLNLNKKLIPIKLESCNIPKRLQILNYADFTDKAEQDNQLQRVIRQIKSDTARLESEAKAYPPLDNDNVDITRLPQTRYELFGRDKELTLLNETWESGKLNIISFVAYGGVGKSSLVKKWVEKLRRDNYRGAEKVFAWSFYSQGTGERVTSADMFINEALKWFGDKNPKQGSAWDKGKRLSGFINNQKTLLILDGLEPLQSDEKVEKGKIKDAALQTLIKELAKFNKGLCIITTRERMDELDRYPKRAFQNNLEHISDEAGRKILETRYILGTKYELEEIVRKFGNHALAVNLLAEYLHLFKGHPVTKAQNIPDLNIPEDKGKHARRIIEAFGKHFGSNAPECQLLYILGLFDRPIPEQAIQAVLNKIPIQNLTDKLADTKGETWMTTLRNLRNNKLIFEESEHHPNTLDCHPLIREHFGEKLESENPVAWKEAHSRLYEYYKNLPAKELPETLEEMEPLFFAVRHGCLSGKYIEVERDVYWKRVKRGQEQYIYHKLGGYGDDLFCLSYFFERLWDKPINELNDHTKGCVLNWSGFSLRAIGRLKEATIPMKKGLELQIRLKNWYESALNASNLCEIYLALGEVNNAIFIGEQSVELADLCNDYFMKETARASYANALHQYGDFESAEKLFIEAEKIQKLHISNYPYLNSYLGFQFCELLLSIGKYKEVENRAKISLTYEKEDWYSLLSSALDKLSMGKAMMFMKDYDKAQKFLNLAIKDLRKSTEQDDIPFGLFSRATFYLILKKFSSSWTDLDDALEIVEYGQMRLHLTDYHLEAARLILAQLSEENRAFSRYQIIENGEILLLTQTEMQAKYREHFIKAETLIRDTGYHRRDKELKELRKFV